jgi:hypothetical protein
MKVAIYSRGHEQELKEELSQLVSELTRNNIRVLLHFHWSGLFKRTGIMRSVFSRVMKN